MCMTAAGGRPICTMVTVVLLLRPQVILHLLEPVSRALPLLPPDTPSDSTETDTEQVERLTAREAEIFQLLCLGARTSEIAERLSISRTTARNHIQHILFKLDSHSRLEAVTRALADRASEQV
ncbi:MAG: helix-turn-helix transcriptional regulator [Chloroflexi bacterium]|nr:helix-turn-helix transcriptional regulator [Chloroflexota bacterium]